MINWMSGMFRIKQKYDFRHGPGQNKERSRPMNKNPVFSIETFARSLIRKGKRQIHLWPHDLAGHFEIHRGNIRHPPMEVHRPDFYLVFLVTAGEGIHSFGIKEYYIHKNMICFAGPEMITSWLPEAKEQKGYLCAFSREFFNLGLGDNSLLNRVPFFRTDGYPVISLPDEQMKDYLFLFEMMHIEYEQKTSHSAHILRSNLQLLIHKANSHFLTGECQTEVPNRSGLRLLRAFTSLYMNDFKPLHKGQAIRLKKIATYAGMLGVTQNHLNDTIKAVTGKSAGQLIKEQLIRQATKYLSSESVNEVAYLLGYNDPSYFARYYKKQTGHQPSALKKNLIL
jgi:AraC family transcriptional activator of pobA